MRRPAWEEQCHIVDDALEQLFKLSRMFGTFPFSNQFKLSKVSLSIIIPILVFTGSYIVLKFVFEPPRTDRTNTIFDILFASSFINFYILNWVNIYWSVKKISNLEKVRKILKGVELIIRNNGVIWTYDLKWYKLNLNFIIFVCLHLIELTYRIHFISLSDIIKILLLNFTTILNQTRGLMLLTGSLISQISFIENSHTQVTLNTRLLSAIQLVNDFFGPQLFFITTGILLLSSYLIYVICSSSISDIPLVVFLIITGVVSQLWQLISSITFFSNKIDEINTCFYKTLVANPEDETLEFHLISKRDFVFSACGFFNFENALIGTIIVTTTTYMVILLQYSP